MNRRRRQNGSALLLVIGIAATLAVLSAALVGLTLNTRHATSTEVTQVKAFNVAEAGLDAGQQALWLSWPQPLEDGTPPTSLPSVDPGDFRTSFPESSYPDPVSGQFIDVRFYDDDDNRANWGIRRDYGYDENHNGYLWIESRGATGPRAAKVVALVQKVMYDPVIMDNVVFATTGPLDLRGGGSDFVIGLDHGGTASIYCGTYDPRGGPSIDFQEGVSPPIIGATDDTIDQVFPDEMLLYLIGAANGAGKEYATAADVPPEAWSSEPRIMVIDSGGLNLRDVPDTDTNATTGDGTIWSETDPGILIILSGDLNNTGGAERTLYGLVYLNDGLILGGNAEIHGMVVAKASGWLNGTRSIFYNPFVMGILNKPVTLSVKLVPNTWRELPAN